MKKLLLIICFVFISFIVVACEPLTTTTVSTNSTVTQSTTVLTSLSITQLNTYVAVTNIFVEVDQAEACMGDQITITVTFLPVNATNQNYTVTLNPLTLLNFVGTSTTLIDIIGEDPSGETISATVTVTSSDNPNITDIKEVYIHHSTSQGCT